MGIRNSNTTLKILWPHCAKFNLRNWPSSFFTLFQTDNGKEEKWKFPGVNWRRLEVPLIRSTMLVFWPRALAVLYLSLVVSFRCHFMFCRKIVSIPIIYCKVQTEWLLGSCQVVIRQSSGSHQAVIRQSSGSHQAVTRQSSSYRHAVLSQPDIRMSSVSLWALARLLADSRKGRHSSNFSLWD